MAKARMYNGAACSYFPCLSYSIARLFRLLAVAGCCVPNCCSQIARTRTYQRFGLCVFRLLIIETSEIVQAPRGVGMFGPQLLLANRHGPHQQRLGLLVLLLFLIQQSEIVQAACS